MTSFRRIEANRRNAFRSTGPRTEEGKRQTRRNAVRHRLCAETVIEFVEDIEDYRTLEAAVTADYDARTVVERELGSDWRRCCGACGALPRSRPIYYRSRPKYYASGAITGNANRSPRNPYPFALSKPHLAIHPPMVQAPVTRPAIKPFAPFPSHKASRREIWRIASNGSPISMPASLSGSAVMKPRCGAEWCRYTFCSSQPDVPNVRKGPNLRFRFTTGDASASNVTIKSK